MKAVYPEGFEDWEIAAIEQFRQTNPELYEWRKIANLIPENLNRPIGESFPVAPTPAKAGRQHRADRNWTPAFVGVVDDIR